MDDSPACPAWAWPAGVELPRELLDAAGRGWMALQNGSALLASREGAAPPLHGHYHDAPLATLLGWRSLHQPAPALEALLRATLNAARRLIEAEKATETRSAVYAASLGIRKLFGAADWHGVAAPAASDLTAVHAWIIDQAGAQVSTGTRRHLKDIACLIGFAIDAGKPRPGLQRGSRQATTAPPASARTLPPPDPRPDRRPVPRLGGRPQGRDEERPRSTPHVLPAPAPGVPPGSPWKMGAAQATAVRTQQQDLAFARPHTLHASDWHALLDWLASAPMNQRAVVAATLLGGHAAGDLSTWCVAQAVAEVNLADAAVWLVVTPPALVIENHVNAALPRGLAGEQAADRLHLPLPPQARGVQTLLQYATRHVGGRLFRTEDLQDTTLALERLRERTDTSASLPRLRKVLPQMIRDATGGHVAGLYLAPQAPDVRHLPKAHYRAITTDVLVQCQRDAIDRLQARLASGHCDRPPGKPDERTGARVGSLLCPDREQARRWIEALRTAADMPPRGQPTSARINDYHNAYVVYTTQLLLWATAVRPTQAGLDALSPVDGNLIVDEKDKGVSAWRAIPLCALAARQWRHYLRHRAWITDRLKLGARTPAIFMLDDASGTKPMTPKRLLASSASPCAANAHRHAWATAMNLAGWRSCRIDQWMGHAVLGEEPGAPFSCARPTFSMSELAQVERHLRDHGWAEVRGLGRG